jgi:peroxiredoxin
VEGVPPPPVDDGAADGLEGRAVPGLRLPSTAGTPVGLADHAAERLVVYVYPGTGVPGQPLPPGWRETPGAFGCTAESCSFRDHAGELAARGAAVVGLSAQPLEEQEGFAHRERIPYPLLNDADLALAGALGLPAFNTAVGRRLRRLTFVVRDGRIEKVFYPVHPPEGHAAEVLAWLEGRATAHSGTAARD